MTDLIRAAAVALVNATAYLAERAVMAWPNLTDSEGDR